MMSGAERPTAPVMNSALPVQVRDRMPPSNTEAATTRATSRALGVNYLLGVGPMSSGEFCPAIYDNMGRISDWMQRNRVAVTTASKLREFMTSGKALSNDGLKAYRAEHPSPELDQAWTWTTGVNATIADLVHGVPPFPYVRESLEALQGQTDVVVVSATPGEALTRDPHWQQL